MPPISVPADRVFPILKQNILVDGFHVIVDLEKSHGPMMVDALTGKEYIDCYSYFASLPIGHNHPKMRDPEFLHSLQVAALGNPSNSDVYTREFAAFVEIFRELAAPPEFPHLFFVAGGALAVENAMKAAFDWKRRKNQAAGHPGGGDKILHFREAFHGRTGYTMSVTNTDPRKVEGFPQFAWPRVSNPKLSHPVDPAAMAALEAQSIAEIEAAFAADPYGIAGILIEPIQGEGGDNHFRPEFLAALRRIADERDSLLLFDEVQTGFGMTGKMWAYQDLGVTPDIVAFGKKAQVCGIMASARMREVKDHVFSLSSRINSTWGGNLVDMVRCARYLQIITEDRLVENAATTGSYFVAELERLAKGREAMSGVRGRGLMIAFDLADQATRDDVRSRCWEAGLAVLRSGTRSLRFRPTLIFSKADVDRVIGILEKAL